MKKIAVALVAVSFVMGCDKSKVSKQITEDTRIVYRFVDE